MCARERVFRLSDSIVDKSRISCDVTWKFRNSLNQFRENDGATEYKVFFLTENEVGYFSWILNVRSIFLPFQYPTFTNQDARISVLWK